MIGDRAVATGEGWAVAVDHPLPAIAARDVLLAGGTAADATVAAVAMYEVVSSGMASLAGSFGGLYHDGATGQTRCLNAGLTVPLADDGRFDVATQRFTGRAVLVPGVTRGLEALWREHGRLSWAALWEPAIELAGKGMPLEPLHAFIVTMNAERLLDSPTAREVYAPAGALLGAGEHFAQPALAATLEGIAGQGAAYMHDGPWAEALVRVVGEAGGCISREDLESYEATWTPALDDTRFGRTIRTGAGGHYGGRSTLLGLGVLEAAGVGSLGPWTSDPRCLDLQLQVFAAVVGALDGVGLRTVGEQLALYGPPELWVDDPALHARLLDTRTAARIAEALPDGTISLGARVGSGHSHNVVIADAEGSVCVATFTMESNVFGDPAIFVGGVPVNGSRLLADMVPTPAGQRIPEPFTHTVILDDQERPVLASGAIGTGLQACQLQLLTAVLAHGADPSQAVAWPRHGGFWLDIATLEQRPQLLLEGGFDPAVVAAATAMPTYQRGPDALATDMTDTGFWAAIALDPEAGSLTAVGDPRLPSSALAG